MKRVKYLVLCLLSLSVITTTLLYSASRKQWTLISEPEIKSKPRDIPMYTLSSNTTLQKTTGASTSTQHAYESTKPKIVVESAYRRDGYASMNIMKKMESPRPLFNFTFKPWKIISAITAANYSNEALSMIVGVKSRSESSQRRNTIRDTWASYKILNGVQLHVIFVVGNSKDNESQLDLHNENKTFGDLLQINQTEIYTDVGYKAIAAMQWVEENCPLHWIYSSADDDMVPNLPMLYRHIKDSIPGPLTSPLTGPQGLPLICGYSFRRQQLPFRSSDFRNYAPEEIYPKKYYPSFCGGGFYSMSVFFSNAIYRLSREHQYFYNDDVWITGLLRLVVVDARKFPCADVTDQFCAITTTDFQDVKHIQKDKEASEYWKKLEVQFKQSNAA